LHPPAHTQTSLKGYLDLSIYLPTINIHIATSFFLQDFGNHGIAPKTITAKEEFSGQRASSKRPSFQPTVIPGVPPLQNLIVPVSNFSCSVYYMPHTLLPCWSLSELLCHYLFAVDPKVSQLPHSQPIATGKEVTFSVEARGSAFVFQWQKDGSNLCDDTRCRGTNADTLHIQPVEKGYM